MGIVSSRDVHALGIPQNFLSLAQKIKELISAKTRELEKITGVFFQFSHTIESIIRELESLGKAQPENSPELFQLASEFQSAQRGLDPILGEEEVDIQLCISLIEQLVNYSRLKAKACN
jgi:hypothetical protein